MSKVLLGEVSHERKETCKGSKEGYPIVGLEHLIPEEITLTTWDEGAENTFTKMFRKGDVLFGRRRAYLKKAAVAPFDGICSGDITVIEADPDKILPELLPFIIQNDDLFDFAVGKSAGSLSPRVKWEHLKNYELELPDMNKQKELAELLWAIDDTKKSYQKLIAATDELVKSQFIEMFGEQKENPKGLPMMTLGETCKFFSGTGFPNKYQGNVHGTYPFYKVGDISRNVQEGNVRLRAADNYIEPDIVKAIKGTIIPPNTVVFAKIGEALRLNRRAVTTQNCLIDNNAMGIQPITSVICLEYFLQFMIGLDMNEYSTATALPSVRKSSLEMVKIIVPDVANQQQFSDLAIQSDKSQFMEQFGYPKGNPKGIPIMRIGEFGTVKGGKRLPKGESYADHITAHPYVRVIDMINHSVNIPELVYLTPSTHEKIARYTISSKDVYISIAGTIGQVGAIPDSIDGANLTENAAKIVLNKEAPVDRDYLIWYLSLPAGAEQIEEKTMRTTQPKLALYRIEEIEVLVPKIDEQRRFAEFVRQSDKSKFAARMCSNLNLSRCLDIKMMI